MHFDEDIADRLVERLQLEGLDEHRRVHSPEEKLDRRIVLVAGKKNEALSVKVGRPASPPGENISCSRGIIMSQMMRSKAPFMISRRPSTPLGTEVT